MSAYFLYWKLNNSNVKDGKNTKHGKNEKKSNEQTGR